VVHETGRNQARARPRDDVKREQNYDQN
jgi:hypothetical protein